MSVFDELSALEMFFIEVHKKGTPMNKLYEMVQHAGNVLTRLYLLVTVGSVYIRSKEAAAKDILVDLVEMVKGVQQPTRGLFLRYYLSQKSKDKLPDVNSEYHGHGGTLNDAIEFILQNFGEMNRLWVRMQHQGPVRQRKRRERERQELRILVGSSLVRLSQLEGVEIATYQKVVLPKVLEQITGCKDRIAQQYLLDCLIQVFPDDFHLQTLEPFLDAVAETLPEVDVKSIMVAMMQRLNAHFSERAAAGEEKLPSDIDAFALFNTYITRIVEARSETMALGDALELQVALLDFGIQTYPTRLDYVDHVLGVCATLMDTAPEDSVDDTTMTFLVQLLTLPQDSLALAVLQLNNYPKLMGFLSFGNRKEVAAKLLRSVLSAHPALDTIDIVSRLLTFLGPLVKDEDDTPPEADEGDAFETEQRLVARTVHLMKSADTDVLFRIYGTARKFFGHGGTRRIAHTLPPLVFGSLALARRVKAREEAGETPALPSRKVFQFVHETCTALASSYPELSLRLFLQSAQVANACHYDAIAYEFFTQVYILYEDLVDSKKTFVIKLIVATLRSCTGFVDQTNYENLVTRATQHSSKLLKKPDQCRMVGLCAQLFWVPAAEGAAGYQKPGELLECLQRSLEIADMCMPMSCELFVLILNHYVYFFERGVPTVVPAFLKQLIALIVEHIAAMEKGEARTAVENHFKNTIVHCARRKADGGAGAALYREVELPKVE